MWSFARVYACTYVVLASLLIGALIFLPASQASGWRSDYRGTPSFDLRDDQRLDRLHRETRRARRKWRNAKRQVESKGEKVKDLRNRVRRLGGRVEKLSDETVQAIEKKERLKKQVRRLKNQIASLENQVQKKERKKSRARSQVQNKKGQYDRITSRLSEVKSECQANPTDKCKQRVRRLEKRQDRAEKQWDRAKGQFRQVSRALKRAKRQLAQKREQFRQKKSSIAQIEEENAERAKKVSRFKSEKRKTTRRLKKQQNRLRSLVANLNRKRDEFENRRQHMSRYRSNLIGRILEVNHRGSREGERDGRDDGFALAQEMGMEEGDHDGFNDGKDRGMQDGQDRAYDRGYHQGDIDGAARAQKEGKVDGTREGTRQGNIDAATREGEAAGLERARSSDAAVVGQRQGEKAGYERADRVGESRGTKKGESQVVAKYEGRSLKDVRLRGDFEGAFDRYIPPYPRHHYGPNYDPDEYFRREVVEGAYSDGYNNDYTYFVKYAYEQNVGDIYNNAYDAAYDRAYRDYANRSYPNSRDRGYAEGERNAFERDYPGIYDKFFNKFREKYSQNPDRQSEVFQETYEKVERETYEKEYERIRSAHFEETEQETFEENIDERTEHYRKQRYAEVEKVYQENAVLKFVRSKNVDAGFGSQGIAARDGVYQPREQVAYSVKLKNFGERPANGAKVELEGKTFELPDLPAGSEVTVVGAAKSKVSKHRTGKIERQSLSLKFPLSAEKKIQGRHYKSTSREIVGNDRATFSVENPFGLSSLSAEGTVVLKQKKKLKIQVFNKSQRAYEGPLKVEISVAAKGDVVVKDFEAIEELSQTSKTLNDAFFKVQDQVDAYQKVHLSAKIKKEGVLLGQTRVDFSPMVKASYIAKEGVPVVAANSEKEARELKDIVDRLGGLENVSVLDTSTLSSESPLYEEGLKGKALIFLGHDSKSVKAVDKILLKSQGVTLITVDGTGRAADKLKDGRAFKKDRSYDFTLAGFEAPVKHTISNSIVNNALEHDTTLFEGDLKNFKKLLPAAKFFAYGNKELMEKVNQAVTPKNFFSPGLEQRQMLQVLNARMINEVIRSSVAYEKDVVEKQYIKEEKSNLIYQLAEAVDSSRNPKDEKIGLYMTALDSFEAIDYMLSNDPIDDYVHRSIEVRVVSSIFAFWTKGVTKPMDDSEEAIDKYDGELAERIRDYEGFYRPAFANN